MRIQRWEKALSAGIHWFLLICTGAFLTSATESQPTISPFQRRLQQQSAPTQAPVYPPRPIFRDDCELLPDTTCSGPDNPLSVCASVRGNGEKFLAHLISYARITEKLGPIQAAAGASSGGISVFLLESVHLNPLVKQCSTNTCCSVQEQSMRISFLLKSMEPVLTYFPGEGFFQQFNGEIQRIRQRVQDVMDAWDSHGAISIQFPFELFLLMLELFDPTRFLASILNPEYIDMIRNDIFTNPFNIVPHLTDITKTFAALDFVNNAQQDTLVYVRPTFFTYAFVLRKLDYLAAFYAGYAPTNLLELGMLLDVCATVDRVLDKTWQEIANEPYSATETCGEKLIQLFQTFSLERSTLIHSSRLTEKPGKNMLVGGNAIFSGDSYDAWVQALKEYKRTPTAAIQFNVSISDVLVGFFGNEETLAMVHERMPILYPVDEYAKRVVGLGNRNWEEALLFTMSEPGFGNGQVVDTTRKLLSTGGWIDGK